MVEVALVAVAAAVADRTCCIVVDAAYAVVVAAAYAVVERRKHADCDAPVCGA